MPDTDNRNFPISREECPIVFIFFLFLHRHKKNDMKYYKTTLQISPFSEDFADAVSALLCEIGYETFVPTETGLEAYIQQSIMDTRLLERTLAECPLPGISIVQTTEEAEYDDWNKTWEEENFRPIVIGESIAVHSPEHTAIPKVEYDILISPHQTFGTGSHQTTRMLLSALSRMPLSGKHVIDAGTGTGILSIMAAKRGAESVFAYDIDEWSVANTKDNLRLNNMDDKVSVVQGDVSALAGAQKADLLIANINRNIILADMPYFRQAMKSDAAMLLSGFYDEDIPMLADKAKTMGMTLKSQDSEDGWSMLLFETDAVHGADV